MTIICETHIREIQSLQISTQSVGYSHYALWPANIVTNWICALPHLPCSGKRNLTPYYEKKKQIVKFGGIERAMPCTHHIRIIILIVGRLLLPIDVAFVSVKWKINGNTVHEIILIHSCVIQSLWQPIMKNWFSGAFTKETPCVQLSMPRLSFRKHKPRAPSALASFLATKEKMPLPRESVNTQFRISVENSQPHPTPTRTKTSICQTGHSCWTFTTCQHRKCETERKRQTVRRRLPPFQNGVSDSFSYFLCGSRLQ